MYRRSASQAESLDTARLSITKALKFLAVEVDKDTDEAQAYVRCLTNRLQKEAQASPKSWQQLSWGKKMAALGGNTASREITAGGVRIPSEANEPCRGVPEVCRTPPIHRPSTRPSERVPNSKAATARWTIHI